MKFELKLEINAFTVLIAVNAIIFILGLLAQTSVGFDNQLFYIFGGLDAQKVFQGSYWLLITSAFFHLDMLHFALNMYSFLRVGQAVQSFYDNKVLLITYIFGALGGSLLSYASSIFLGQNYYSLGASGAIFALIGLLVGGSLRKYRYGYSLPFSLSDILPVVLFSLAFGFLPNSNINNYAHIGGLVTGIILGLLLKHSLGAYKSSWEIALEKILYIIAVVIFIGSFAALIYNAVNILFLT